MKPKEIFEGFWYVRGLERRYGEQWEVALPYERDEWIVGFLPEGRYAEIYRPHRPTSGEWSIHDGIITIDHGNSGNYEKCIFREEARGTFIYYYNDFYRFSSDPSVIVKTYAHTRQRIENVATVATAAADK